MKQSGVTLIELMVAATLGIVIAGALATSMGVAIHHQQNFTRPRADAEKIWNFEDRVTKILSRAAFDSANSSTYFTSATVGGGSAYSDQLNFTVLGAGIRGDFVGDSETDFSARNQSYGPVGGLSEARLSTTAIGDSGGLQGLFYRTQTPVDSDHENGGTESLLSGDVSDVSFEFWDSSAWQPAWDTTSTDTRLPDAVRVHYYLTSDPNQEHTFVVVLPNSDGADDLANAGTVQPSGTNP